MSSLAIEKRWLIISKPMSASIVKPNTHGLNVSTYQWETLLEILLVLLFFQFKTLSKRNILN